jgi:translation initiation factor IF-2
VRVHELAKELGVASKELLDTLEKMGAGGRSASSSVPDDIVPRLRASGGKAVDVAKPKRREILEPAPVPRKPGAKTTAKATEKVAAKPAAKAKPAGMAAAKTVAP